jgi:redox-sensitive bicupin YhaK (pirin superfamily)
MSSSLPDESHDLVPQSDLKLRRSGARGAADRGWLQSRFTFAFAEYEDPEHTGFRTLRVINEDRIAPGKGFGTHPHRDMEIFSYVLSGTLLHRDSLGNGRQLGRGQIQLMSAGCGVMHSEWNPSQSEEVHFLQVWIQPRERGGVARYTEWQPNPENEHQAKVLVISSAGREGSAQIGQDAEVYRIRLTAGAVVEHEVRGCRGVWLQVAEGSLELNGVGLEAGDGVGVERSGRLRMTSACGTEALLFDLG